MEIFRDETEFTDIRMVHRVVDMFEKRPHIQRIVRLGLLGMDYGDELDVTDEDDYKYDNWVHGHSNSHGYPRLSDRSSDRGLSGNHTRASRSGYQPPLHYYTSACDLSRPLSELKVKEKESDTERRSRLLQEPKKKKGKAEKKRLKKQKQKERKRLEKLEKEKQNPEKNEGENGDAQQSKAENGQPDDASNFRDKRLASGKDTDSSDSSEDESSDEDSDTKDDSGDSEELDMTSTFVNKAALIARRKLEQKPRPERREKKKTPVNEEPKTVPDNSNGDPEVEKKDSVPAPSSSAFEDNVKISTDLANTGNRFASAGDFNMAVKYFTDAIKYNPTEFKLFGNRSFCFERMREYEKALTDAELSLNMCPGWVKGLFRKGRALAGLKRYEEAAQAFREVLKLDSSCAEAAQELMRVQITQLMAYGFTRDQSSNALIIHGTVKQALKVLSRLNGQPGAIQNSTPPPAQVANVSGVSPVLSANTNPAPAQAQGAPKTALNKPLGPVQNMSNVQSHPKPIPNQATKTSNGASHPPQELFPVWVGNLVYPVTELVITSLFNKVGEVYSAKVLTYKRCAFVNFTKQEHCDEAIRHIHGYELNGNKIAVRYPDRIPQGMGISKSALKAEDLQDENVRVPCTLYEYIDARNAAGSRRPVRPYKHVPDYRGNNNP
ncbi:tetratricopeptide repeat protein 31-like isoform X2 [Micropterus dolomieu]|uniref:tetratricopeptide repeat protein 31-like isoform X2 n=2 Tax=Micropterus dolomieu TaxID=147949 RepID=UPI001E8E1E3E|nr:tetratricopeptide repeat protein 31-like isoform X2 [Micropterus dolomieu]